MLSCKVNLTESKATPPPEIYTNETVYKIAPPGVYKAIDYSQQFILVFEHGFDKTRAVLWSNGKRLEARCAVDILPQHQWAQVKAELTLALEVLS
jgi:hypothetical protein